VSPFILKLCRRADGCQIAGTADKTTSWGHGRSALTAIRTALPAEGMTLIDCMHFPEQSSQALTRQRHISGRPKPRLVELLVMSAVFLSRKAPTIVSFRGMNACAQPELTKMTDCSRCDKGSYDLCKTCYQTGEHCRRKEHVLTKYYAWKYKRLASPALKKTWTCSNPDCLDTQRKNEFYFSE
jgi:hypothetical protein